MKKKVQIENECRRQQGGPIRLGEVDYEFGRGWVAALKWVLEID